MVVRLRKLPPTRQYPCFASEQPNSYRVPRLRDKALGGRRPAGDIICMIPPAPPPNKETAPDPFFPFPPSTISFPCALRST